MDENHLGFSITQIAFMNKTKADKPGFTAKLNPMLNKKL